MTSRTADRSWKWYLALAAAAALALPASASAQVARTRAVLVHSSPLAGGIVSTPPVQATLTFSGRVDPRAAIVSVTDGAGRQWAAGRPHARLSGSEQLTVPLRRLARGWYLVSWRASASSPRPASGEFTFAVGPNPGPPPEFVTRHALTGAAPHSITGFATRNGYHLELRLQPNRAGVRTIFTVRISKRGRPVRGALVSGSFTMLDMEMGLQSYRLVETAPGLYGRSAPALLMAGYWAIAFEIRPHSGSSFAVLVLDRATG